MKKVFFDSEKVLGIFTDRHGGVSKKPFDSLNLGFHVGDEFQNVLRNRKVLLDELRIERLVWMNQIHSNVVKVVENEGEVIGCDAIVAKNKKLALMIMASDCNPILLYDPVQNVIGAVHSGREGTFEKILQKTIEKMGEKFDCEPENILASIGPSIGPCCYEVAIENAQKFKEKFGEKYVRRGRYLDLKTLCIDQLTEAGVPRESIEIIDVCTCCDENYFSYRREEKTGRFAGIIMLK